MADHGPPSKRQRVSQACESCRKRKIKCDGSRPTCTNCTNCGSACVYTETARKPQGRRKRHPASVGQMERRLERIEELLGSLSSRIGDAPLQRPRGRAQTKRPERQSELKVKPDLEVSSEDDYDEEMHDETDEGEGEDGDDDGDGGGGDEGVDGDAAGGSGDSGDSDDDPRKSEWLHDENLPVSSHFVRFPQQVARSTDMYSVSTAKSLEHYSSNGSLFAIFSKVGMQWVADKVGDPTVPDELTKEFNEIYTSMVDMAGPVIEPGQPLPPDPRLIAFCSDVMDISETWTKLLSAEDLQAYMKATHDPAMPQNGYAESLILVSCCSIALAMMIFTGAHEKQLGINTKQAWDRYMQYNASCMHYLSRLLLIAPSLVGLRSLIMTCFGFQMSGSHLFDRLTNDTVRYACQLGLHRYESTSGSGMSTEEAESRRLLFWVAFDMDCDVSMRVGRCPAVMEFDISARYPLPAPVFNRLGFDFQSFLNDLMRIYCRVYERLYSARASMKPRTQIVRDILALDKELLQWRDSIPPEFRPGSLDFVESLMTEDQKSGAGLGRMKKIGKNFHLLCGIIHVHYCYHQLISMLHRITAYYPSWVYASMMEENKEKEANKEKREGKRSASGSGTTAGDCSNGATGVNGTNNGHSLSSASSLNSYGNSDHASPESRVSIGTPGSTPTGGIKAPRGAGKYSRLFRSLDLSVQAARDTIALTWKCQQWSEVAGVGALFFAATSFITLFIKCITRPRDASTIDDLELLNLIVERVFKDMAFRLLKDGMPRFWEKLYKVAKEFVGRENGTAEDVLSGNGTTLGPGVNVGSSTVSALRSTEKPHHPSPNTANGAPPGASSAVPAAMASSKDNRAQMAQQQQAGQANFAPIPYPDNSQATNGYFNGLNDPIVAGLGGSTQQAQQQQVQGQQSPQQGQQNQQGQQQGLFQPYGDVMDQRLFEEMDSTTAGGDISFAQGLYQVSSLFSSFDADLFYSDVAFQTSEANSEGPGDL